MKKITSKYKNLKITEKLLYKFYIYQIYELFYNTSLNYY